MTRQGIARRLHSAGFTLRDTNLAKARTVEFARLYFEDGLTLTQVERAARDDRAERRRNACAAVATKCATPPPTADHEP